MLGFERDGPKMTPSPLTVERCGDGGIYKVAMCARAPNLTLNDRSDVAMEDGARNDKCADSPELQIHPSLQMSKQGLTTGDR